MAGIAATTLSVGVPVAAYFVWGIPVTAALGALAVIFRRGFGGVGGRCDAGWRDRTLLSVYFASRFARTVIAVLSGSFCSSTSLILWKC